MRVLRLSTFVVLLLAGNATAQEVLPPAARIVLPGTPVSEHPTTVLPPPLPAPVSPVPVPEVHHASFLKSAVQPGSDDCERNHPWGRGWFSVAFFVGKAENLELVERRFVYGAHVGAGCWLDTANTIGLDAGFFTSRGTYRELYANSLLVDSPVTVWTTDFNVRAELYRDNGFRIDGLLGYRYVHHNEDLFTGDGMSTSSLSTQNQINVAQVGANVSYHYGPYFGEIVAKLGIGQNNVETNGNGLQLADRYTCFVSEFGARAGYQLGERLWGLIGYRALYLGNIDRPGQPQTSYFIHGLTIGIEKRF